MTVLACQKIFNQILEENVNPFKDNITCNLIKVNNYYKITKSNNDIFAVSFHPKINIDNKIILHNHDFFELAYVYKGSCINYFENEQFEMTEGNILLLNPDVKHEVRTNNPDDCLVNLIIGKNIFENSMMTLLSDNQLMLNFFASYIYGVGKSRDYFYFYNINNSDITKLLEMIVTEFYEKNQLSQNICQSLLIALLSQLSLHYSNQAGIKLDNHNDALIISILNYINEHCINATLDKVSSHFNYSERNVSRLIKKHTGKTFKEVQTDFKLKKAKHYLKNTDFPIQHIADLLNYNNASYLYKIFKDKYGITPAEYRKL